MKSEILILFLSLFFIQHTLSSQGERILDYKTEIEVKTDRSIIVTEYIEVFATGDVIKRGITRNLPKQRYLNDRTVGIKYEILEVEKDGKPEPYLSEDGGDLILYLGSQDVFLSPGVYKYKIKYRVPNQIAFYEGYDEIYWNALGNDIRFNVEQASVSIVLPNDISIVQESAYLGYQGDQGNEFTSSSNGNIIVYTATRSLRPNEGFTVALGFKKGFFDEPGIFARFGTLMIILLGLLFLIPYYVYTWWRFGQDPATPASYPLWEAPNDLSAASTNYILKGKYQSKSFSSSIIDLAIKGYIKIEEVVEKGFLSKSEHYDLVKLKESNGDLPKEEKALLLALFMFNDRVSIKGKYDATIENTYDTHKASLAVQHNAFLSKGNNTRLLWLPILVTVIIGALSAVLMMNSPYAPWINLKALIVFVIAAIIGNVLYGYLIRKPTTEKLDLRSKIKGFQMYLEMTEKDRLNLLNPPEMTPEHFESILPFAFALGVEHKWSEKFKDILEKAQYRPEWHNSTSPVYFSNHFGRNFSKNVSAAATKPTQSGSGSGGGGFSGGGGGGGGVGGW